MRLKAENPDIERIGGFPVLHDKTDVMDRYDIDVRHSWLLKSDCKFNPHAEIALRHIALVAALFALVRGVIFGVRHILEIRVDGAQFFIVHLADRTPGHSVGVEVIAIGIDTGAQGGNELLEFSVLHDGEAGCDGANLSGNAARQISAMTGATVMIGKN